MKIGHSFKEDIFRKDRKQVFQKHPQNIFNELLFFDISKIVEPKPFCSCELTDQRKHFEVTCNNGSIVKDITTDIEFRWNLAFQERIPRNWNKASIQQFTWLLKLKQVKKIIEKWSTIKDEVKRSMSSRLKTRNKQKTKHLLEFQLDSTSIE